MTEAEQKLLRWHRAEYARRTAAAKKGIGSIDWMVPGYRISWSEIAAKAESLGVEKNVVEFRQWWYEVAK